MTEQTRVAELEAFDQGWLEVLQQTPFVRLVYARAGLTRLGEHPARVERLALVLGRSAGETTALVRDNTTARIANGLIHCGEPFPGAGIRRMLYVGEREIPMRSGEERPAETSTRSTTPSVIASRSSRPPKQLRAGSAANPGVASSPSGKCSTEPDHVHPKASRRLGRKLIEGRAELFARSSSDRRTSIERVRCLATRTPSGPRRSRHNRDRA